MARQRRLTIERMDNGWVIESAASRQVFLQWAVAVRYLEELFEILDNARLAAHVVPHTYYEE